MNFLRPYILQPACEPDDYTYCQNRSAPYSRYKGRGNIVQCTMYEVQSTKYKVGNTRYLPAVGRRSTELRKYQEARDKSRETRDEKQETRAKRQEPRNKRLDSLRLGRRFFSKRDSVFLCVFAPACRQAGMYCGKHGPKGLVHPGKCRIEPS